MKAKNHFLLLALFVLFSIFSTMVVAQQLPSTSGYLPSSMEYYESLPLVVPTPQSLLLTLPYEVDNTTKPYFPRKDNDQDTLFFYNQHPTASCQNVATVWNTFTYEINRLRNLQSNTQETRYAPNFSHNHLNRGYQDYQGYTSLEKVQKFLMETGAMSDAEFDGPKQLESIDSWRWPSGYDYYYKVMQNKLDSVRRFDMGMHWDSIGDSTVIARVEANLMAMKHYLNDYAQGDENNGGVITFGREFVTSSSFGLLTPC